MPCRVVNRQELSASPTDTCLQSANLDAPAPIPAMVNLPIAQPYLHCHAEKASHTDTAAIADRGSTQTELPILGRDVLHNLSKGVDIDSTTEQTLPKDNNKNDINRRDKVEQGVQSKKNEVGDLKQRRQIQMVDADKRGR